MPEKRNRFPGFIIIYKADVCFCFFVVAIIEIKCSLLVSIMYVIQIISFLISRNISASDSKDDDFNKRITIIPKHYKLFIVNAAIMALFF